MASESKTPVTQALVNIPGLQPIPVVAIRLASGQIVLRHPDEIQKPGVQPSAPKGE